MLLQGPERVERAMVLLCRQDTAVYMVLDGERPIGRVVAPDGEPMLGPGAETVLLRRAVGTTYRPGATG
jgi:hypothetical protein